MKHNVNIFLGGDTMYEMRRTTYVEGEKFMPPNGAVVVCGTSFQDNKGDVYVELWMAVPTDSTLYSGTPDLSDVTREDPGMAFLSPKDGTFPIDYEKEVEEEVEEEVSDDVLFGPEDLDGL